MRHRSFIRLYIRRSFTRNLKKQLFLILGIAAFMTMATEHIIGSDSEYNNVVESAGSFYWGYSQKFFALSPEQRQFLVGQPGITDVYVVKYMDVTSGIANGSFLVSAGFPKSFQTKYLYGSEPGQGEVALPESARIAGKRPETGQEILFEVQSGEEKQNVRVRVSGVFKEHPSYNVGYVAMYAPDFESLLLKTDTGEKCFADVFYNCTDEETAQAVWGKMLETYGTSLRSGGCGIPETSPALGGVGIALLNLLTPFLVGAVSMIAILYILLKDERKTLGIFRALGATKKQVVLMLTAQTAVIAVVGAVPGRLLGEGFLWLKRFLMFQTEPYNPGIVSAVMIPLAAVAFFLLFQIPGVLHILRKSEVELMNGTEAKGENLISYQNRRLHRVKHPLWWYSGLEPKRIKLNTIVLCLVTMSSLVLTVSSMLQADSLLKYNSLEAVETDYAVSRKEGAFSRQEIESILALTGVEVSGYGVQVFAEDLVTLDGKKLRAKLQIIEETSFYEFKVAQRTARKQDRFRGTLEEALAGGRILVEPTYSIIPIAEMLPGDTLYVKNFQGEDIPFEIAAVGVKQADDTCECYVYVGFDTYEKLFGMPELAKFHVALDGVTFREAKEAVEGLSKLYILTENNVLVGYTKGQLEWDSVVMLLEAAALSLLISFSFLICYYSFYFLSKSGEYRMLYAQGASKKMLQKLILFQALRLAVLAAVVTVGTAILLSALQGRRNEAMLEGLAEISFFWWMVPLTMLFVILVSVTATWLASKAMLKNLDLVSDQIA